MLNSILSIQSHVVFGYVGNKAATYPLQSMGYDVSSVNTTQFSTHTGYEHYDGEVHSGDSIRRVLNSLKYNGFADKYSGFLSGYMGSVEICNVWKEFILDVKKEAVYLCDPVIGDDDPGVYVSDEIVLFFTEFLRNRQVVEQGLVDIITPNIFEAEVLSGIKCKNDEDLIRISNYFHDLNIKIVVITGLFKRKIGNVSAKFIDIRDCDDVCAGEYDDGADARGSGGRSGGSECTDMCDDGGGGGCGCGSGEGAEMRDKTPMSSEKASILDDKSAISDDEDAISSEKASISANKMAASSDDRMVISNYISYVDIKSAKRSYRRYVSSICVNSELNTKNDKVKSQDENLDYSGISANIYNNNLKSGLGDLFSAIYFGHYVKNRTNQGGCANRWGGTSYDNCKSNHNSCESNHNSCESKYVNQSGCRCEDAYVPRGDCSGGCMSQSGYEWENVAQKKNVCQSDEKKYMHTKIANKYSISVNNRDGDRCENRDPMADYANYAKNMSAASDGASVIEEGASVIDDIANTAENYVDNTDENAAEEVGQNGQNGGKNIMENAATNIAEGAIRSPKKMNAELIAFIKAVFYTNQVAHHSLLLESDEPCIYAMKDFS